MTMNIKQFCEMTGLTRQTILSAVKKLFPDKIKNGKVTKLNEIEATDIIRELRLKDLPNLSKNLQVEKPQNLQKIDRLESMFVEFMKQQTETNKILLTLIQNNSQKQIELKQDYFSLLGYMRYKNIDEARFSEMIVYGKEASKISRELGLEIRKIPDERFGQVNSYHISVLERLFEI
jgi:hypothetical protein